MAERSEEDDVVQIAERSMSGSEEWVHLLAIPRERHRPPRSSEGPPMVAAVCVAKGRVGGEAGTGQPGVKLGGHARVRAGEGWVCLCLISTPCDQGHFGCISLCLCFWLL